jgi:hypothetical protein
MCVRLVCCAVCAQIEGLLSKYASHLLTTGKTFAAIELYRKANKATDSALLLAKMALDIAKDKVCVGVWVCMSVLVYVRVYVYVAREGGCSEAVYGSLCLFSLCVCVCVLSTAHASLAIVRGFLGLACRHVLAIDLMHLWMCALCAFNRVTAGQPTAGQEAVRAGRPGGGAPPEANHGHVPDDGVHHDHSGHHETRHRGCHRRHA